MSIRINSDFIKKWELVYDEIENDEEEYKKIIETVKNDKSKGVINKSTFVRILRWKTPRVLGIVDLDNFKNYKRILRKCLSKSYSNKEKLAILDDLRGIGVPVASTILHFIFPDEFPIMDIRTVEVLHEGGYIKSNKRDQRRYPSFRNKIKNIQQKFFKTGTESWSLREIDRALFAYHKTKMNKYRAKRCKK